MSTSRCSKPLQRKTGLLSLSIAIAIFLLMSFISLAASRARWASLARSAPNPVERPGHSDVSVGEKAIERPSANAAPTSTPPGGESQQTPPSDIPNQMADTQTPSAASDRWIHFDDVPSGTQITSQYSPAIFSSDPAHFCVASSSSYYGSSFPNRLTRGPSNPENYGYAPIYVNFTSPVNNLRFLMLAADANSSNIAQIRIFKNNQLTATRTLPGFGNPFGPITINVGVANNGMGYDNVTRIEIINIIDPAGLSFDDFMFTVAPAPPPTPTPTPQPSPTPNPPTNLHGEGHIEEITLVWDLQANTTGYNVKRRASFEPSWTVIATNVQPTVFSSFGNTTLIGRYRDNGANPDILYSYAVTAVNANGESPNSNVFSASIAPSCGDYVEPKPPERQYFDSGNGWALTSEVSDKDGFVTKDVSLKGRYMAKMMSVPYFVMKTNKMAAAQRSELTPDSSAPIMRARLLRYNLNPLRVSQPLGLTRDFHFVAEYAVDRLTPTSKSCLRITQEYVFLQRRAGDKCEPSGDLPCARFYPKVSYKFEGRTGETLESINIPQRLHYRVGGSSENTIGLFRDWDNPPVLPGQSMFESERNPVAVETFTRVVRSGRDLGIWDNIHQTNKAHTSHPMEDSLLFWAGCPECVHTHWRWPAYLSSRAVGFAYGTGLPIVGKDLSIFNQTNQDVDLGIVRYKPGEEHPSADFRSLLEIKESLRNITRVADDRPPHRHRIQLSSPADVLYWYSGTSYEPDSDLFFKHGSFFNPDSHQNKIAANAGGGADNSPSTIQDGVRSITYAHVYKEGITSFTNVDLNTLPLLPAGYVALDNRAHRITTEAIVSGPHVVAFDVPSVNEQALFNDLAIFHLELDPFDPDNMVWVDTTILSPDTPAPDFINRIVNARVNDIGYFVIGKLVQAQPDPGSSDLSVTVTSSSGSLVVENNLSYAVHVTNAGPQASNAVGLINVLPQEATFVSVSSSQGTCKYKNGSVYCKLGTLASGSSADISIVANTIEDKAGIPPQGLSIINTAVVAGDNDDSALQNNSVTNSVTLLPHPNSRPFVSITSPLPGATYSPSAAVNIIATATDSNGSIAKVDFYDGTILIGTGTANAGNQYLLTFTPSSGPHSLVAVATDNGSRANASDAVSIFVKGNGNVTIASPSANTIFDPGSSITVIANATGSISKVELFANSISLGECIGGTSCGVTWNNVPAGSYLLTAVVTDSSGAKTTSEPVNISVTSKPTVSILSPVDGMSYPLLSRVAIMASAQDSDGFVSKVDFYANGSLIGTGSTSGQDQFTVDWMEVTTGVYSLTAVATDNLGVSITSAPITIGVNTPSPRPGEFVWFDDALPSGALTPTSDEGWHWVTANPGAFSGTKSHQSRNFGQLQPPNSFHQHYFEGASTTLPVNAGDKLFTYVFLDINNLPREIMLQWKDANGWEHRAYWGENRIDLGIDGTASRFYMGALPQAGRWARLEVQANAVGLEGATLYGMAFSLDGGRATFDLAGKTTANAPPPPTTEPGDFVWIEDAPPLGAITAVIDDHWNWVSNPHYSGQVSHVNLFDPGADKQFRSHSFTGAQTPMQVNPGDVLFTYVYLGNPSNDWAPYDMPDQIMLQWYDGSSWEHRASWGVNFIGARFSNLGVQGTEGQRYMGGLPPARGWYRLEVPASYVGLEGKAVSGMAFTAYRNNTDPFVAWDRSGKSSTLTSAPPTLASTSGVWMSFSNVHGYTFEMPDVPRTEHQLQKISFHAHPNQAAGTVPMHRFRRPGNYEYFYHTCRTCPGNDWQYEGIAFYVYPDATTPGTLPLYLYHNSSWKYFLTVNQSEAAGMTFDQIWGYVYPNPPAPPTSLAVSDCTLSWMDNSNNETGFKIEHRPARTVSKPGKKWTQVATVGTNVTSFSVACPATGYYRVRAFNSAWNSAYSNEAWAGGFVLKDYEPDPPNTAPEINIVSPANGDFVDHDFAIAANAFDLDGNGTIAKVEFLANAVKLGEVSEASYIFPWTNVPAGTYSLTAIATDVAGASTTSAPVTVTVNVPPTVSITSPASGAIVNGSSITISASASDGDGSITKVEFVQGSIKLGEDVSAPYGFEWSNVPSGSYLLTAVATDSLGRTTTSSPISLTVNAPPNVNIITPAAGTVFTAPAAITLGANANDEDGTISVVELYQGATLLGTDTTSPYNFTWTNVSAGSYSITAKATDDRGAVTTSNPISITVNALPNVTLTSPTSGVSFVAPADIIINALASDDGSINRVEFFQGATLLGTDTTAPYGVSWINVPLGSYSLTAKATDNLGATTTSNTINITVVQGGTSNKIAFASNREGIAQIYSMNSDGSNVFRLTASNANDESPKWSPNNSRIVFQSDRDNPFCDVFDIYSMNSDGSAQTRLTTDINDDRGPVWSPDGTKIAFQSLRNGVNYQVYVMNVDGSGQVNISNSTSNDTQPSWSPDGTRIAFASDRDQPGFPSIYVMNANGSNQTRLTFSASGFRDEQPEWSPNGTKLAFTSTRDSTVSAWEEWILREGVVNKEIYVMNADGSSQARLTNKMGNDDSPAWSPDGTRIVFRSDRDRNCCDPYQQVWMMNADGSNQLNLSNNQFGDHCPSWSR